MRLPALLCCVLLCIFPLFSGASSAWNSYAGDSSNTEVFPTSASTPSLLRQLRYGWNTDHFIYPGVVSANEDNLSMVLTYDVFLYKPNGSVVWAYTMTNLSRNVPLYSNVSDRIFVLSDNCTLYALHLNGSLAWRWEEMLGSGNTHSHPVMASDGTVLFGSPSGFFYAFSPGGAMLWSFDSGGGIRAGACLDSSDNVYFANYAGHVFSLSLLGAERWNISTLDTVFAPLSFMGGSVYMGGYDNIYRFYASNGTEIWNVTKTGQVQSRMLPVIADDAVYATFSAVGIGGDGRLRKFYISNGTEMVGKNFTGDVFCPPVIVGGSVVVLEFNGDLRAYNRTTMGLDWNITLPNRGFRGHLFFSSDMFFIMSRVGVLIWVGTPTYHDLSIHDRPVVGPDQWEYYFKEPERDGYFLEGDYAWSAHGIRNNAMLKDERGNAVEEDGHFVLFYDGMDVLGGKTTVGRANFTRTADKTGIDTVTPMPTDVFEPTEMGWMGANAQLQMGSVIKMDNGSYVMFFCGNASASDTYEIYMAWSDNGYIWNPRLSPIVYAHSFDGRYISLPSVVKSQYGATAGNIYMFIEVGPQHIGLAYSWDWETWYVNTTNKYAVDSLREGYSAANPRVTEIGPDKWIMGGNIRFGTPLTWRGHAWFSTRPDTGWNSWNKDPGMGYGPILELGESGEWDDYRVEQLDFFKEDLNSTEPSYIGCVYFGLPTSNPRTDGKIGYVAFFQNQSKPAIGGLKNWGEQTLLYAAGYDNTGRVVGVTASWSLNGALFGSLSNTSGEQTTYYASNIGETTTLRGSFDGMTHDLIFTTPQTATQNSMAFFAISIPLIILLMLVSIISDVTKKGGRK